MIAKKLNEVTEADIDALLSNEVSESKTIEYKSTLPGGTDSEKKEFLADVSALANTRGGDLIYGIDEDKGIPTSIPGVKFVDADADVRRLESLIRDGITPRIKYETRVIQRNSKPPLLIIRVDPSWNPPHRVEFQRHNKFYARSSTGKYLMDVPELRDAFTFSSSVAEKVREFRTNRITRALDERTPVPFEPGGKTILHLIPLESFSVTAQYDFLIFANQSHRLPPMYPGSAWSRHINLDGVVTFNGGNVPSTSYTQLFRNGILEAVGFLRLGRGPFAPITYPHQSYERELAAYLGRLLAVQQELGVVPPVAVALTMSGVKGMQMASDFPGGPVLEDDLLILPETIAEDLSAAPGTILKPTLDLIWNALGYERCPNFDDDGMWLRR